MNTYEMPNPAANPLAHMPSYYYLYGRKGTRSPDALRVLYPPLSERYQIFDFSADNAAAVLDKPPHTVEQLITHGYFAVPKGSPELSMITDRRQTAWLGLEDVLSQVHQRQLIYEKNMHELEWGKCYAFNELARHGWPATEQQYARYQRRLQELHTEQRAERVAFWKDVPTLRLALPESVQHYLSAFRKLEILDDDGGDVP